MKRLPLIIGVVFAVVIVLLAGVFVYDAMIKSSHADDVNTVHGKYSIPNYTDTTVTKPKTSFSAANGGDATGAASDVNSMLNSVDQASNSSDVDLQSLQKDVNGL